VVNLLFTQALSPFIYVREPTPPPSLKKTKALAAFVQVRTASLAWAPFNQ
jgi:hypothetical protein